MRLLKEINPEGVSQRRQKRLRRRIYHSKVYGLDFDSCNYSDHSVVFVKKKGPNFIWHADGYDKLATFGIRIHGCIDG